MSDEEIEDFEISDYDLKFAMNPNFKRTRQTKEDAMLGVWAEREFSDDSNDGYEGFKQKKRTKSSSTKNIQFISSGVKGEKPTENKNSDNDENVNESDDSVSFGN
jgi:hypothetical protein